MAAARHACFIVNDREATEVANLYEQCISVSPPHHTIAIDAVDSRICDVVRSDPVAQNSVRRKLTILRERSKTHMNASSDAKMAPAANK